MIIRTSFRSKVNISSHSYWKRFSNCCSLLYIQTKISSLSTKIFVVQDFATSFVIFSTPKCVFSWIITGAMIAWLHDLISRTTLLSFPPNISFKNRTSVLLTYINHVLRKTKINIGNWGVEPRPMAESTVQIDARLLVSSLVPTHQRARRGAYRDFLSSEYRYNTPSSLLVLVSYVALSNVPYLQHISSPLLVLP